MATPPTNLSGGTLSGATWIVGTNSTLSLGANITTDAAAIILNGTGTHFTNLSPLASIAAGGSLNILGGGSFTTAGNLDNAGTVDLAPGTLNVTGTYTQEATGAYDVAVGGTTAGSQLGQLKVTKQATLNGALSVSLINNYTPPQGDSYPVLTFASESGNFATAAGLYLGGGLDFVPTFSPATSPTALDLVVSPAATGTTTSVTSSLSPSTYGQAVTFTATVAPSGSSGSQPTGSVAFYDGSTELGCRCTQPGRGQLHHDGAGGRVARDRGPVRRRLELQRQRFHDPLAGG